MKNYYFILLFLVLLFWQCKKEPVYPTVAFEKEGNFQLAYGDTLTIAVSASDFEGGVDLAVLDGAEALNFDFELQTSFQGRFVYRLFCTDKYVESGAYDLKLSAENGEVGSSVFADLRFTGLSKQVTGVAYSTLSGEVLLSDFTSSRVLPINNQVYSNISYNPDFETFYLVPSENSLEARDLDDPTKVSQRDASFLFENGFGELLTASRETYVLKGIDGVELLQKNGNSAKRYALDNRKRAVDIALTDNNLICLSQEIGVANSVFLTSFNKLTGQKVLEIGLSGQALAVDVKPNGEVLVLLLSNSMRQIFAVNLITGVQTKMLETPLNVIDLIVTKNGSGYLYGEGLYRINTQQNIPPTEVSQALIGKALYEPVGEQILVISGNTLSWLNLSTGNKQVLLQTTSGITDATILYNK